jgi:hypothetical protein
MPKLRLLFLLALICLPAVAAAQVDKGESTISGRVVFADTGKPVRRATVRLFSRLNHSPSRITWTNARGEYRFNEVAAGTYFVLAEIPGGLSPVKAFGVTEFGFNSDIDVEPTRVTVDGKGATRCELRVVRAGAIRGTIVYADKEPVTGARIALFRRKNGVTLPFFGVRVETNDRGTYRIDGLPEGEYFVGVVDTIRRVLSEEPSKETAIVAAYYPAGASITEAKAIVVQAGSEVSAINITLRDDQLHQISGVMKWRDSGEPVVQGSLQLRRLDEPTAEPSFFQYLSTTSAALPGPDGYNSFRDSVDLTTMNFPQSVDANAAGEWKFPELPPGKYVIRAYAAVSQIPRSAAKIDGGPKFDFERDLESMIQRRFEVILGDTDLNDVVLEMTKGARISGKIATDESPVPRIWLFVNSEGRREHDATSSGTYADGSFVLDGVPSGDTRIEARTLGGDLYVKSITLGNQDLMRSSFRVEEGAEITGIRITLERGSAKLSGRALLSEGGSPAVGSGVLLVKADPALLQSTTARALATVNAAGEFFLECPPGDYLVFTWAAGNHPPQSMAEFIRTHAPTARRITLQRDEEKQIELIVAKPKQ